MLIRSICLVIGVVFLAFVTCLQTEAWAQQSENSPAPMSTLRAATASPPVTASLEERIAAARSVRVMNSILDIELGSELDEAHEKLDKLCSPGTLPKEEGGDKDKKGHDAEEKSDEVGGEKGQLEHNPEAGEEQDEGLKVSKSPIKDHNSVVWDVLRPDQPLSLVVAIGSNGKADSIRLFVVRQRSSGTISYKGM